MTSFKLAEEGKTLLRTRPLGNLTCIRHVGEAEAGVEEVGVVSSVGVVAVSIVSEEGVVSPVLLNSLAL